MISARPRLMSSCGPALAADVTALLDSLHDPGRLLNRQAPGRQLDTPPQNTASQEGPRL